MSRLHHVPAPPSGGRSGRDERGAAMVEAPFAIALILLLGFGVVTLVQLTWTHLDLASSVRGAARYAARVEYDPSSGTGDRRRSATQVVDEWKQQIADEVGVEPKDVTITVGPDPTVLRPGDEIVVSVETTVTNPVYGLAAGATNGLAQVFGASGPFPKGGVKVKAQAVTYLE